ncbi:MAG: hypothetical protein R2798_09315 [Chitinophagales bacterium]|nr:hypothetical protein [Bacteroidota bacterium]MCB9043375.1 hypothetical protein [Chitinophagales bacterium]
MQPFTHKHLLLLGSFLLISIAFSACKKDHEPVYSVPAAVEPFVQSFIEEAALRGENLTINDLIVEYNENLENNGYDAAGLCHFGTQNDSPFIELDTTSSNWQANEYSREQLIFHELGHCILNRQHKETILPNEQYASIMKANGDPLYASFNLFKRTYYLDELFDGAGTLAPDWAKNTPSYNDISNDQKEIFLSENFNLNQNGWNLDTTPTNIRKFENGTFYFESLTETAFFTGITRAIDTSRDFEIETTFIIEKGGIASALFLWGGDNQTDQADKPLDTMLWGNNIDAASVIGSYDLLEEISREKSAFLENEANKLTIRKIGDTYQFFVNELYYDGFPFIAFKGNLLGFLVPAYSAIRVENLYVYYL